MEPIEGASSSIAAAADGLAGVVVKVQLVDVKEVVTFNGITNEHDVEERLQYINLDESVGPHALHRDYGRKIRLKARIEWVSGNKSRPGLAKHKVYWYWKHELDPKNHPPRKLTHSERARFDQPGTSS
jgi:hypothetical protein